MNESVRRILIALSRGRLQCFIPSPRRLLFRLDCTSDKVACTVYRERVSDAWSAASDHFIERKS